MTVVAFETPGYCIYKNCAGTNCTAEFWKTTTKECTYIISAAAKNERNTVTECQEPAAGCAITATELNSATVSAKGTKSSIVATASQLSKFSTDGLEGSITASSSGTGDDTKENYSNEFNVTCSEATTLAESCKIVTTSGSYNTYFCAGPYCTTTNTGETNTQFNCTGAFCSIADKNSYKNKITCGGNDCTVGATNATETGFYVMPGVLRAVIKVSTINDSEVESYGGNNDTVILIEDSDISDGVCVGAHCNVTVVDSYYSKPSCEGYNCTVTGRNIINLQRGSTVGDLTGLELEDYPTVLSIKVKCYGDACYSRCENSYNCTAYCKGEGCYASCFNNTICYATCDGEGCLTSCIKAAGGNCTELRLPKKSTCENCLHAPDIYGWEVCRDNYTDCKVCFTAEYEILGVFLYKLGCMDDILYGDICPYNYYVKACYIYTCKDELCTRSKMYNLIAAESGALSIHAKVKTSILIGLHILWSLFSLIGFSFA